MVNSISGNAIQNIDKNTLVKVNSSPAISPVKNDIPNISENSNQESDISLNSKNIQNASFSPVQTFFTQSLNSDKSSSKVTETGLVANLKAADNALPQQMPVKPVIGAYFNKIESGKAINNAGISLNALLPQVKFDESRFTPRGVNDKGLPTGGETLDTPSVYVGGNVEYDKNGKMIEKELDCGLSWDKVYDKNGDLTYTIFPNGTDGGKPELRFSPVKTSNGNVEGWRDGNGILISGKDSKKPQEIAKTQISVNDFSRTLQPNGAFRPFWRTTNTRAEQLSIKDERTEFKLSADKKTISKIGKDGKEKSYELIQDGNKSYYLTGGKDKNGKPEKIEVTKVDGVYYEPLNLWHNPDIKSSNNVYFYPGQNAKFDLKFDKAGTAELTITKDSKSGDNNKFTTKFTAKGFEDDKKGMISTKAVVSVDQKGTEGRGVSPTGIKVTNGELSNVNVLKDIVTLKDSGIKKSIQLKDKSETGNDILKSDINVVPDAKGEKIKFNITPDKAKHEAIAKATKESIKFIEDNKNTNKDIKGILSMYINEQSPESIEKAIAKLLQNTDLNFDFNLFKTEEKLAIIVQVYRDLKSKYPPK